MIQAFHIKNFKALRDVTVPLEKFTIFVGANGVGKSSALDAIHYLLQLSSRFYRNPERWVFGRAVALFSHERSPHNVFSRHALQPEIVLGAEILKGQTFQLRLEMVSDENIQLKTARFTRPDGTSIEWNDRGVVGKDVDEVGFFEHESLKGLSSAVRLRLDDTTLTKPSPASTNNPRLEFDGAGLPTVLQYLAGMRDGTLDKIEKALRDIVPSFKRVHTRPTQIRWVEHENVDIEGLQVTKPVYRSGPGFELSLEFDGIGQVPAYHVSEGTLIALAILTHVFMGSVNTILIDDLERGLHPRAQHQLIATLQELVANQDLQIIATTHSPELVDSCEANQVRVFGSLESGETVVWSLTDHPEAKKWLGDLSPGEFWSSVGESPPAR